MPRLIMLAGPNGAGKSTHYKAYLRGSGLAFINADELAKAMHVAPEDAASFADKARDAALEEGLSFITETVFSDPVGAKLKFLEKAAAAGYDVELHFIGISGADLSEARVACRVIEGGHDVPSDRLPRRYEQSRRNLGIAIKSVSKVFVFDNSSAGTPYRMVLRAEKGLVVERPPPTPEWLLPVL